MQGGDFAKAGDASSKVKRILQQIGAGPEIIRRVAVACYEAEMNVVIHAHGGTVTLDADLERISVTVEDEGPGIEDIDQAMTPGFSTAPDSIREMGFGAGMGLPNMKSCLQPSLSRALRRSASRAGVGRPRGRRMAFDNA